MTLTTCIPDACGTCSDVAAPARTAWVNSTGLPVDRLPARPHHVVSDLNPIPDLARP
jgi:hypothetical protein